MRPGAVALTVVFEPALCEAGVLQIDHECGLHQELVTGRVGADLRLPPGPVRLLLRAGDRTFEKCAVVHEAEVLRWSLVP